VAQAGEEGIEGRLFLDCRSIGCGPHVGKLHQGLLSRADLGELTMENELLRAKMGQMPGP
jgi:hypothetical protein